MAKLDSNIEPKLPDEFVTRLHDIVGGERVESCLRGFAEKRTCFRVNTLKANAQEVVAELTASGIPLRPVSWCDHAFSIGSQFRDRLVHNHAFIEGRIYIQNQSSLLPVLALDPQPHESVLDLAAAPGGKTLHIAALMNNQGMLSAVEPIKNRFHRLRRNLDLFGASMVKTYMTDGRTVGSKTGARFDKILLDAPCSSEARFRIDNPKSCAHWSLRKIREQSRKQVGLLKSAIRALKPGGKLIYCTCSFAPEENELVVQKQLKRFAGEIQVEALPDQVENQMPGLTRWQGCEMHASLRNCVRILPNEDFDGFFMCKVAKMSNS